MTPILADSAAPRSRTKRQSVLKQIMAMPAGAIFLVFMTLQIVCIAGALLFQLSPLSRYTAGRVAEELVRAPEIAAPALVLPQAAEVVRATEARGAVGAVAEPMFQQWLVPFELTSVLLLAAIVGAVVLAKRRL